MAFSFGISLSYYGYHLWIICYRIVWVYVERMARLDKGIIFIRQCPASFYRAAFTGEEGCFDLGNVHISLVNIGIIHTKVEKYW